MDRRRFVLTTALTLTTPVVAGARLPSIYPSRTFAEFGGLMSYGYDREELVRRAASQIDRILRGAKPADLPVEQSTPYELVVNLRTARTLGLMLPPALLARADRVIDQ
jgi:ABC-type uncharacterized transport system substrate-binding protein